MIKKLIKKLLNYYFAKKIGGLGVDSNIHFPCYLGGAANNIFLADYTLIQPGCRFIMNKDGKFFLGKWSSLSCNCLVITGNHKPTVGVNQRALGRYHINDEESVIVVGSDCWVGANVTLLKGAKLNRGCIVGACSLVNKEYPPYSVIAGVPAKIIASKFTKEQIIEHEKKLYPLDERMSTKELNDLFDNYFVGKKSIGIESLTEEDKTIVKAHADMQFEVN